MGNEVTRAPHADSAIACADRLVRSGPGVGVLTAVAKELGFKVHYDEGEPIASGLAMNGEDPVLSFSHRHGVLVSVESCLWFWSSVREDYGSERSYLEARARFDAAFEMEARTLGALFGPPTVAGLTTDVRAFCSVAWELPTCLVVALQTDHDPQAGTNILLWIDFGRRRVPRPPPADIALWLLDE